MMGLKLKAAEEALHEGGPFPSRICDLEVMPNKRGNPKENQRRLGVAAACKLNLAPLTKIRGSLACKA